MEPTQNIRAFSEAEWPVYRDLRLRALGDSPDAFCSTFVAESARADAQWQARLASGVESALDLPLVAISEGRAAGLAWVKIERAPLQVAEVFQMWVAPEARGRGLGSALLGAAVAWAKAQGTAEVHLDVTCGDTAAMRMYLRGGFRPFGGPRPLRPGSALEVQPMRLILAESA